MVIFTLRIILRIREKRGEMFIVNPVYNLSFQWSHHVYSIHNHLGTCLIVFGCKVLHMHFIISQNQSVSLPCICLMQSCVFHQSTIKTFSPIYNSWSISTYMDSLGEKKGKRYHGKTSHRLNTSHISLPVTENAAEISGFVV